MPAPSMYSRVSEELDLSASASAAAPSGPMQLPYAFAQHVESTTREKALFNKILIQCQNRNEPPVQVMLVDSDGRAI